MKHVLNVETKIPGRKTGENVQDNVSLKLLHPDNLRWEIIPGQRSVFKGVQKTSALLHFFAEKQIPALINLILIRMLGFLSVPARSIIK